MMVLLQWKYPCTVVSQDNVKHCNISEVEITSKKNRGEGEAWVRECRRSQLMNQFKCMR
jgi:hypothetical protein